MTTRTPGGATRTADRTRLHRAALATHDGPGRRWLTLGRMPAPSLAAVSLFDGALVEQRGTRWDAGVFAGTQPEPERLAWSGDRIQAGGFARWHEAAGAGARHAVTAGLASSTDRGRPDRDFGFVQAAYAGPTLSASLQQEVDANRGWKRDRGVPALSLSGTHALLSWRLRAVGPFRTPGPGLTLRAGLDRRQDVWLWRDRATPETEFDDRTRQGGWTGLALEGLGPLRLSGEARVSTIAGGERQTGWSGALESDRRGPANLAARARVSRLTGAGMTNTLVAAGAGIDPSDWAHLDLSGGLRRTTDTLSRMSDEVRWETIDLDLVLPRHTYLDASFQNDHGGAAPMRTVHASLTLRF